MARCARDAGAGGFGARGFLAVRGEGVGRHIAVEIRHAVDKAVAVIAERRPAGGQHGAPLTDEG